MALARVKKEYLMKTTVLISLLIALNSSTLCANEFNKIVDDLFTSIDQKNAPGCNVGVIKDGAFIHKKGYGLANMELGVGLNGDNVHRIGSLSK